VLDVEGAAAHEVAGELFGVHFDGPVAIELRVRLTPAVDAGVGLNLDEEPVLGVFRVDDEGLERGDFHERLVVPPDSRKCKAKRVR
jgi:hypothetical protein